MNADSNICFFQNGRRSNQKIGSNVSSMTQNRYESLGKESSISSIAKNNCSLPALYLPRERVRRNLNCSSEYSDSYDHPKCKLMFNNLALSRNDENKRERDVSNNQFAEPMKFSYIGRLNQDTSRSLNLPQGTTSFIPKNYEKAYMSLNENPRSKMNDLFFKNNKILTGENIKFTIPGYSGFVPSDIKGYRGPDRKFVLSTKDN